MTASDVSTRIVIAGGGVAAIESVLALRALGGIGLHLTLVAESDRFRLPPLSALTPFARGHSDAIDLREFMHHHGGELIESRLATVEVDRRVVVLADATEVPYDELIVAVGGQPVKGTDRGTGFDPASPDAVAGIASDLELGWAGSVAVVIPDGPTWPLPGYEIALQLAMQMQGEGMSDGGAVHLFIPTDHPVPFFGRQAGDDMRDLLAQAGVELHANEGARVVRSGVVDRAAGLAPLQVDRVLAIPLIEGPAIPGIPEDDEGFIRVDEHCRVVGVDAVHAAGDGTNYPVKLGAVACQMADVAVRDIIARRGAGEPAAPLAPLYDARLVAGPHELVLHHDPTGAGRPPVEWPDGAKIAGEFLTPWVQERGLSHVPNRGG